MKATSIYILCLAAAFIQACIDPISFETNSEGGQLVFYGNFSQLNEEHLFYISQTSDFGKPVVPVTGASIVIIDDQGNSADYQEIELGKYQLSPGNMQGIPGRSYHVEVTLVNGKIYFTTPQIMPEPIEADEAYFEIETRPVLSSSEVLVDKTFIDIYLDTPLQNSCGESFALRWTVEEVYSFVDLTCGPFDLALTCYFWDPADESEVLLFENKSTAQDNLRRFNVRSRLLTPYDEFTARHYFIVRQHTISEEELSYWNRIKAVANQSGSLFDVQPARVAGNIIEMDNPGELVLGNFGVNGQNVLRTFTTPFSIRPNPVFDCMDATFFRDHPVECCTCSAKAGIQIERPPYWDED